jgi:pimeloyl-ACP methyl ester carboxylesterase
MYPEMTHKTLRMPDGCQLGYQAAARGADVTLLLIHDALCDAGSLEHISVVNDSRLNILLPDLRGHGESTGGAEPWSLDLLAGDLVRVIEAEAVDNLILAGESLGALVAARMASLIPHRVGLVICAEPLLTPSRLYPVYSALLNACRSGSRATAAGVAGILGYTLAGDDQGTGAMTFHGLLSAIPVPCLLLHGTAGEGALATVIDQNDLAALSEQPGIRIRQLAVPGADRLVLRTVGGTLVRALLSEMACG